MKEEISFQNDVYKIDGTIFYPDKIKSKNPAVLFVHGWTSERKRSIQYAEALSKLGFICFTFDIRGHGTSEGNIKTFTTKEFFDDVIAAYDYLTKIKHVDPENISAIGSSYGGYFVAILTSKRRLKNIVLRAPADYPNEHFNKNKAVNTGDSVVSWRNKQMNYDATYALKAVHEFDGTILIIESEKDDRVPHQTVANYINSVKNKSKLTHIIMKGAPHSIKEDKFRDEVTKILVNWFSSIAIK